MANTEAEYRKKRVEENRDTENLITEKKSDENIFEKQVFDILEYLEKEAKGENNSIARKILKLKEYGITDKEIETRYKDKAGSRETIDSVSSILESVFEDLVNYINDIPNGVYIDFATAEKNDAKGFEQAIQYGIYPEDSVVENLNKTIKESLQDYFGEKNEKVTYLLENFKDIYIYNENINKEIERDLEKFLDKNEDEMNLSDTLKQYVKECKESIANSHYESDPNLFEICKLQVMLKDAKNSQDYNEILGKIKAFYKANPEYVAKELPVLDKNGVFNKEEIKKMQEFSETYQRINILEHIDEFNGMTHQELLELNPTERTHMLTCAFSGLRFRNDNDEVLQEIARESMKMINQLCPNLDLKNDKELAGVLKEIIGIDAFSTATLEDVISISSRKLKETTEYYLEKNKDVYRGNKFDIKKLDWDARERVVYDSAMQNFFVGSSIEFTEEDEEAYNKLYQDVTLESWIETKENAIKLRYAALTTIRDEYKNNPVGTYTEKKLVEIERDIEEFERRFGKVDLTAKEGEVPFDTYREDFITAGITKYLTRDAREWSYNNANYEDLSPEHKKGYIRNILVALDNNKDNDSYMTKIALRRLELMGDDFVKINSDGSFDINEELILKEYKKYSDYSYPSFEQLAESAKLRKNEYLLKKLEEYTNLPESSFGHHVTKDPPEEGMAQIEEIRYLSNQKRIEQYARRTENRSESRDRRPESSKPKAAQKKETPITDKDVFESVKGGTLAVEVMDTSATKINTTPQVPRDETIKNQVEESGQTGESSAVSEMRATTINTSAIIEGNGQNKNVKPSFIETIKNAFAIAKNAVSRLMKNEDKPKELGPGRKEMTEEERKAKYDETFRPVDTSQTSRTAEPIVSTPVHTQTTVRGEER